MRPLPVFLTLLLLLLPSVAAADICEDIATGADNWAEIADWLDELTADGSVPSQSQAEEIDAAIQGNLEPTLGLIQLLASEGNSEQQRMGRSLERSVNALDQAETFDEIIAALDAITDELDAIVENCDAHAATTETAAGPAPAAAGKAAVAYEQPTAELAGLATAIRDSGVFDEVAADVAANIALPRDLPIRFTNCGEPNAFYDPNAGAVTMCYELFALANAFFANPDSSAEENFDNVLGAGVFFLLHEIGHALVHQLDLPITGREEDAVDSLATVILIQGGGEGDALAAVDHFDSMALLLADSGEELAFWDEHSLNEQRVYDVACLVFGSDPEAYASMVSPDYLPPERARRCEEEYEQKFRAWSQLLGDYLIGD